MQVILRDNVDGLGKVGDVVDVADGYARNFLLPKGKALKASRGAIDQAARMRRSRDLRDQESREAATTVASTLVPKIFTIAAKTSSDGRLFGSVTASEIVDAVAAQAGVTLDRKAIHLDEHIKTTGSHEVTAQLHPEVSFPIRLMVVDEDADDGSDDADDE